nr:unnamed protein product [Callosobruchus chinensis]
MGKIYLTTDILSVEKLLVIAAQDGHWAWGSPGTVVVLSRMTFKFPATHHVFGKLRCKVTVSSAVDF